MALKKNKEASLSGSGLQLGKLGARIGAVMPVHRLTPFHVTMNPRSSLRFLPSMPNFPQQQTLEPLRTAARHSEALRQTGRQAAQVKGCARFTAHGSDPRLTTAESAAQWIQNRDAFHNRATNDGLSAVTLQQANATI
ncbi:hypothetical protein VM1G_11508 [Cytospora mali]|uniref:Uncharacterized protein n=1 Tax=Cytospora mali TaxID=578113 RepID=A0A194VUX6_CYTMA|nr:hypothetical protein VM1G_11508 [Valsa mali]